MPWHTMLWYKLVMYHTLQKKLLSYSLARKVWYMGGYHYIDNDSSPLS